MSSICYFKNFHRKKNETIFKFSNDLILIQFKYSVVKETKFAFSK